MKKIYFASALIINSCIPNETEKFDSETFSEFNSEVTSSDDSSNMPNDFGMLSDLGEIGICGNGILENEEECDNTSFCDETCRKIRHVFVSSLKFTSYELAGIEHADYLCQQMASVFPNWELYHAWLSDTDNDAKDHVNLNLGGKYISSNDSTIAEIGEQFLTGDLNAGIVYDQNGILIGGGNVWTGTKSDGTKIIQSEHCNNWTVDDFILRGYFGRIGALDSNWTLSDSPTNPNLCALNYHIYCFES